jgi:hypothetical protein
VLSKSLQFLGLATQHPASSAASKTLILRNSPDLLHVRHAQLARHSTPFFEGPASDSTAFGLAQRQNAHNTAVSHWLTRSPGPTYSDSQCTAGAIKRRPTDDHTGTLRVLATANHRAQVRSQVSCGYSATVLG